MIRVLSTDRPLALVTGAAGFIGSHLVERLLTEGFAVVGLDNFVRGHRRNLARALKDSNFVLLEVDCSNAAAISDQIKPYVNEQEVETVWHLAANSDIGAGVADPNIDLRDTFMTTFAILDIMQKFGMQQIAFTSSSAIYGQHAAPLGEDDGPLLPASNYGAMKLASEAAISASVQSNLKRAWFFRFPNVVGSRANHGVIFDLLNKLKQQPSALEVLGDGNQCKPYVHVDDVVDAMWFIWLNDKGRINQYNIGPDDGGATVRFIAEEVVRVAAKPTPLAFTGGESGWVGDVPCYRYNVTKLRNLGWSPKRSSDDAVRLATKELFEEIF
jgi:UDP-glucose 4-epimerase